VLSVFVKAMQYAEGGDEPTRHRHLVLFWLDEPKGNRIINILVVSVVPGLDQDVPGKLRCLQAAVDIIRPAMREIDPP
jgi:hypothetical protein